MKKLDLHANLIRRLHSESPNIKSTHKALKKHGIDVVLETLRSWILEDSEAKQLPKLRKGRPVKRKDQLFMITPQKYEAGASSEMPSFFRIFFRCPQMLRDEHLRIALEHFGIKFGAKQALDKIQIPLSRLAKVCDLELYTLAYLLVNSGHLVGLDERDFESKISKLSAVVFLLKNTIQHGGVVTVRELRLLVKGRQRTG